MDVRVQMRVQLFLPFFGAPKRLTSSQSTLFLDTASCENQNDIMPRKRAIKFPKESIYHRQ